MSGNNLPAVQLARDLAEEKARVEELKRELARIRSWMADWFYSQTEPKERKAAA